MPFCKSQTVNTFAKQLFQHFNPYSRGIREDESFSMILFFGYGLGSTESDLMLTCATPIPICDLQQATGTTNFHSIESPSAITPADSNTLVEVASARYSVSSLNEISGRRILKIKYCQSRYGNACYLHCSNITFLMLKGVSDLWGGNILIPWIDHLHLRYLYSLNYVTVTTAQNP